MILHVKSIISDGWEEKEVSPPLLDSALSTIEAIPVFTGLDEKRGNELTTLPRKPYLNSPWG
jgi:hypothetical protein